MFSAFAVSMKKQSPFESVLQTLLGKQQLTRNVYSFPFESDNLNIIPWK